MFGGSAPASAPASEAAPAFGGSAGFGLTASPSTFKAPKPVPAFNSSNTQQDPAATLSTPLAEALHVSHNLLSGGSEPTSSLPRQPRRLTRRLLQKTYRTFVEQQGFRRRVEEDQLDDNSFKCQLRQTSHGYLSALYECTAAAHEASLEDPGSLQERFGFRFLSMMLELYDIFYIEKEPVQARGQLVPAASSYARELLRWCHRHVSTTEATMLQPDWGNVCRCLVQGYLGAALNMIERLEPDLDDRSAELAGQVKELIVKLAQGNLNLCFDQYGWYGGPMGEGWTNQCKALATDACSASEQPSVFHVAKVLAGEESFLQKYSRHGLDLMLARVLFVDPQCAEGHTKGRAVLSSCASDDRPAPGGWSSIDFVCVEGLATQDSEKEARILDLVWSTVGEDGPGGTRGKLEELQRFCRAYLRQTPLLSSWLMAHLVDLLEHAAVVPVSHASENNNTVVHEDASFFLERYGEELCSCGLWPLAANYFHFRQDATGPYILTELLSAQPPTASIQQGVARAAPSSKRSWKLIHCARTTLIEPSFSHIVASGIAKTVATYHWPQPIKPLSEGCGALRAHPALCAFWLLEASCLGQLLQLSEQLVEDVLVMAQSIKDISSEASKATFQRYAADFSAVDAVLTQALQEGLQQCTAFHDFYGLWKAQLRLLCSEFKVPKCEDASYFSQLVVQVMESEEVPRHHWLSLLRFIVLPLMTGQWRGRIFDAFTTGIIMQKLHQASQMSPNCPEVAQIRYALTENLSAAIIFANEIRC